MLLQRDCIQYSTVLGFQTAACSIVPCSEITSLLRSTRVLTAACSIHYLFAMCPAALVCSSKPYAILRDIDATNDIDQDIAGIRKFSLSFEVGKYFCENV